MSKQAMLSRREEQTTEWAVDPDEFLAVFQGSLDPNGEPMKFVGIEYQMQPVNQKAVR